MSGECGWLVILMMLLLLLLCTCVCVSYCLPVNVDLRVAGRTDQLLDCCRLSVGRVPLACRLSCCRKGYSPVLALTNVSVFVDISIICVLLCSVCCYCLYDYLMFNGFHSFKITFLVLSYLSFFVIDLLLLSA